jgi:glutathione S-transferase
MLWTLVYPADKYRDKGLPPGGLKARAQAYRWIMFAVTELEQPLWRTTGHTFLYPEPSVYRRTLFSHSRNSSP